MQVCPKCGAQIRYIATGYHTTEMCDSLPLEVVSKNGSKFVGYPIHQCEENKKANERNNKENS